MATAVEEQGPRKRIKELEVMVAESIAETPDTTTLVLFTGNDRLEYEAGHFLTIDPHQFAALDRFTAYLEDVKGRKEPPRAYSLTSAPHERYLAITIKEEVYVSGKTKYPPLMSPLLVRRTPRGTRMIITGFTGPYVLPRDVERQTDHLVHVVAGSGSVPNFAILKDALHRDLKLRHTFLYSNKTYDDICFRRELASLERELPGRLRVIHALTRERDELTFKDPHFRRGRIDLELLREAIPDPSACLVYACGPAITPFDRRAALEQRKSPEPRFLETVLGYLHEMGVPDKRIKRESYG